MSSKRTVCGPVRRVAERFSPAAAARAWARGHARESLSGEWETSGQDEPGCARLRLSPLASLGADGPSTPCGPRALGQRVRGKLRMVLAFTSAVALDVCRAHGARAEDRNAPLRLPPLLAERVGAAWSLFGGQFPTMWGDGVRDMPLTAGEVHPVAVAGWGIGALGMAVGTGFAVRLQFVMREWEAGHAFGGLCRRRLCSASDSARAGRLLSDVRHMQRASALGFAAAVAGFGAGGALSWLDRHSRRLGAIEYRPWVGVSSVGVVGSF